MTYDIQHDLDTLTKHTVAQRLKLAEREQIIADLRSSIITEALEECVKQAVGLEKSTIYVVMYDSKPTLTVYMYEPKHTDLPRIVAARFHTTFTKSKTSDGLVLEAPVPGWGAVRIIGYVTPGCELKRVTRTVEIQEWEVTCPSGDDDPAAA